MLKRKQDTSSNIDSAKQGFTLIEVMLVFAITGLMLIGVLAGTYSSMMPYVHLLTSGRVNMPPQLVHSQMAMVILTNWQFLVKLYQLVTPIIKSIPLHWLVVAISQSL